MADHPISRSARVAIHQDDSVRSFIPSTATVSVSLSIGRSRIASPGTGLFVASPVPESREIFRSKINTVVPACVEPGNKTVCHYCLADTSRPEHPTEGRLCGTDDSARKVRACMKCKLARFCSKKCQVSAWNKFHKSECTIFHHFPNMPASHQLVCRVLLQQKQNRLPEAMGQALSLLEDHFADHVDRSTTDDKEESPHGFDFASDAYDFAMAIRKATSSKIGLRAIWRLVPAILTNATPVRSPSVKAHCGLAIDLLCATINHSCDPNAFIIFEGGELRVRSIRSIAAGEEVTVCYVDPAMDVSARREMLRNVHFFECGCKRCKDEHNELRSLLSPSASVPGTTAALDALRKTQRDIVSLIAEAVAVCDHHKQHPTLPRGHLVDPDEVATTLTTLCARPNFPSSSSSAGGACWPAHLEPLPAACLSLAQLYLCAGRPLAALRYALRGVLQSRIPRSTAADWATGLFDILANVIALLAELPSNGTAALAFADAAFPRPAELHIVANGYAHELARAAAAAFGADTAYARAVAQLYAEMAARSCGDGAESNSARPGTKDFASAFATSQARLLAWAGIERGVGVVLD